MAKARLNTGLDDIHGRISDWVYKRVRGKRVITPLPRRSTKPLTEGQVAQREDFARAAAYGRAVLKDPARRPAYERVAVIVNKPLFSVIVRDYFTPPTIHDIILDAYTGAADGRIVVRASDDVEVAALHVTLRTADGTVLEQGPATLTGEEWVYTATTTLPANTSVTIEVAAKDHPGNETKTEATYP